MSNIAKVKFTNGRYELKIMGVLKGYTQGDNQAEHDLGKKELVKMATDKGYTVIND